MIPESGARDVPRRLGPYRIERPLGSGAAGRVFVAVDEERGFRVALKTLADVDPVGLQQLKAEFRNVASVEHRNLARHYELMQADGAWFFTMELLAGEELGRRLRADLSASLPTRLERARGVFSQLASGLAALHQQGVLHLDLNPTNVFVEPDGRVVLLDFGISTRSRAARASGRHGTPDFMAPEQLRGRPLSAATDWYALGLLLFQALVGRPARGDDPYEALEDPEQAQGIAADALPADLPQDLRALCQALLRAEPGERPTANEVLKVLGAGALPLPASAARPLIGRDDSLAALQAGLTQVEAGAALLVHVAAESGVGKSSLVARFLEDVSKSGRALVLAGRCYEWESVPYKGLDAAVDELAVHLRELGSHGRRELDFVDYDQVSTLFPVLRRFAPPDPEPSRPGDADPTAQRARAFQAFRQLLACITEKQPIVCFIDDAHWSDIDCARLLLECLSLPEPPRVLLVLAYRSAEAERSEFLAGLRKAVSEQAHSWVERRLRLEPLNEADSMLLARELLGDAADAGKCLQIAREGQGNPFFVEELVRSVVPSSRVTLDDVLTQRIARLPEDAQRVLQVIAVAGRLPEQDLALVAGGASADPHRVLATLRAAALVRTSGPRKTDAVEPYHDRIREGLVRALSPATLIAVHRALATTLLSRPGTDPHVLSVHFEGAGELEVARRHAVSAAQRAAAALAFERVAAAYERALALGPTSEERPRLLEQRALALFNAGRGAEAGPVFLQAATSLDIDTNRGLRRRAVESFLTAGRVREGVQALVPLCHEVGLRYHAGNGRATLSVLVQLVRLFFSKVDRPRPASVGERSPELQFQVDLCWAAGRGLSVIRPAQGLDFLLRGLSLAARLNEPQRLARSLTLQGSALVAMGGPLGALGARWLARAAALAEEHDDPYLRGLTDVFSGFSEVAGAGRWPLAMAQAERGMQTLERDCTGVGWEHDMAMAVWLKAFEPAGDMRTLGDKAAEWARGAAARGDAYTQNVAASFIVPRLLADDDVDAARAQARVALADWHDIGYTVQHYHATRLEIACDLYAGDAANAWRRFQAELPKFKEIQLYRLSLSRIELLVLEAVVRMQLASGVEGKQHRAAVDALAARLARETRCDGVPHATMIRAVLDVMAGKRDRGVSGLERARELYLRADMPQWSWAVARRLGELTERPADVAASDEWFTSRGVASPTRWTAQFLPVLTR